MYNILTISGMDEALNCDNYPSHGVSPRIKRMQMRSRKSVAHEMYTAIPTVETETVASEPMTVSAQHWLPSILSCEITWRRTLHTMRRVGYN